MDITGKAIIFVNEYEGKKDKKALKTFSTTIITTKESKNGDEEIIRKSMRVYFAKELGEKAEKLDPAFYYEIDISEGWLKCEKWTDKSGSEVTAICAFIKNGTLTKKVPLKPKKVKEDSPRDNDLPF